MKLKSFLFSLISVSLITGCGSEVNNVSLSNDNLNQNANISICKIEG